MAGDLKDLEIDRSKRRTGASKRATAWIPAGVFSMAALGRWELVARKQILTALREDEMDKLKQVRRGARFSLPRRAKLASTRSVAWQAI